MMAENPQAQALVARILFLSAGMFLVIAGLVAVYGEIMGLDQQTTWIVSAVLLFAAVSDAAIGQYMKSRSARTDRP